MSQVFVDSTGRRRRVLALVGFLVALFATAYIAIIGASVVESADAGLTTKATVSVSATASATPTASASA